MNKKSGKRNGDFNKNKRWFDTTIEWTENLVNEMRTFIKGKLNLLTKLEN